MEYKYTIEVTLRSEFPKSNSPNIPTQGNPNTLLNIAQLMPILSEVAKNIQVKQISPGEKEADKK